MTTFQYNGFDVFLGSIIWHHGKFPIRELQILTENIDMYCCNLYYSFYQIKIDEM